ncbi:hypothetical protein PCE1_002014 [Barthelona sp. PCE]
MFGNFGNMMGGFGAPQQQPPQGGMMNGMMNGMGGFGAPQNQQPQQPQQGMGGMFGMMNAQMGNAMGAGAGMNIPGTFGNEMQAMVTVQPMAAKEPPQMIPIIPSDFTSDIKLNLPMIGQVTGKEHVCGELQAERQDASMFGQTVSTVKFFSYGLEFKQEQPNGPFNRESMEEEFPYYSVPPFARYVGCANVEGIETMHYNFDLGFVNGDIYVFESMYENKPFYALRYIKFGGMMTVEMLFDNFRPGVDMSLFEGFELVPPPVFPLSVQLRDASNGKAVDGAAVDLNGVSGSTTNSKVTLQLQEGNYQLTITKDGYLQHTENLLITAPILKTVYMVPVMPEGEARCLFSWTKDKTNNGSYDLDFHAFKRDGSHVYFRNMRANGIRYELDYRSAPGSETLHLDNSGEVSIIIYNYSATKKMSDCNTKFTAFNSRGKCFEIEATENANTWIVGVYDTNTGAFRPINRYTNDSPTAVWE